MKKLLIIVSLVLFATATAFAIELPQGWTEIKDAGACGPSVTNPNEFYFHTFLNVQLTNKKDDVWQRTKPKTKLEKITTPQYVGIIQELYSIPIIADVIVEHRKITLIKYPLDTWSDFRSNVEHVLSRFSPEVKKDEVDKEADKKTDSDPKPETRKSVPE